LPPPIVNSVSQYPYSPEPVAGLRLGFALGILGTKRIVDLLDAFQPRVSLDISSQYIYIVYFVVPFNLESKFYHVELHALKNHALEMKSLWLGKLGKRFD